MIPHFIILPVRDKKFGIPYWRKQAFFFNMVAWMSFYDEYGWDMEAIPKIPPGELTAKMIYHAAMQGNYRQGKPFKVTFADLTLQVAKMTRENGAKLDATFQESAKIVSEKMAGMTSGASKKK